MEVRLRNTDTTKEFQHYQYSYELCGERVYRTTLRRGVKMSGTDPTGGFSLFNLLMDNVVREVK